MRSNICFYVINRVDLWSLSSFTDAESDSGGPGRFDNFVGRLWKRGA
jgi:hypothetical protein